MKTITLFLILCAMTCAVNVAIAQGLPQQSGPKAAPVIQSPDEQITKIKVTVTAKGDDVRTVLTSIFGQAKQQFVLTPNIRFVLYLSLENMDFDRALTIICAQSGLEAVREDDVYFVRPREKSVVVKGPAKRVEVHQAPVQLPVGPIPISTLKHRINARYAKEDLKSVMMDLGRQANVKIELASEVPNYKIDAVLVNTSLKYALDMVCKAARLKFLLTDNQSIRVDNLENNRVSLASN